MFRKAFVIANIFVGLLILIIVNIPTLISLFSDEEVDDGVQVLLSDQTEDHAFTLSDDLALSLNQIFETEYYTVSSVDTFDIDDFWLSEDFDVLLVFTGNISSPVVNIYSQTPEDNAYIMSNVQLLINQYQIDNYAPPTFIFNQAPDYQDPGQQAMVSSITTILILPMFLLITMATQFIGVDIIEEKSTKAIETIIASVPAKIHFLSKITSSLLFIIIQSLILLAFGSLAALIGNASSSLVGSGLDQGSLLSALTDILPNWQMVLVVILLFMFTGTLFYLLIASLFAAMATTQEDYQQFQSPLMLILVGGFYIGIFAPLAGGDGLMRVMSYVPIFTPMVAPVAFASGVISIGEVFIALGVLIVFTVLTLYIVAPVYRVAILSYEQTKFFKRILSNFKKAFQKTE
jgi:ABC-2 type transport system permease protein